MKKILTLLIFISSFAYSQQTGTLLSPKAINGYTTNGKVLITATDGSITGVPTWTVPNLTVNGGTLTGTPINGTLTIPTSSTTSLTQGSNISITGSAPSYTVSSVTPTLIVSGASLTGVYPSQTLTVPTNSTSLVEGSNISLTNSGLTYTVSVASSLTNSVINNTSAISTLSTNVASNTSSISANTSAINTLSTNVTANTSSITTLQSSKQNTLVAGTNITLNTNTISSTTPTLTVVNGTLSGSYPTQTLTIPTTSTTIVAGSNITTTLSGTTYTIAASSSSATVSPSLTNSYVGFGNGSNLLSGSSELTYSTSIFKINASKTNTTDVTSALQVGSLFMGLGDVTQNNQPTFIEMFKGNGSNAARSLKGSMGFLGTTEMNLSINMDYRTGSHKYYDPTVPAAWIYLGHSNGFGIQYVPANNPNSNIYNTYGCIPFKVSLFNQPSSGKGIDGFSKISFAQAEYTDITNTSTLTATPCTVSLDGGILKTTSISGIETRVTGTSGNLNYQTGTGTGADMKLQTSFTTPLGNPSLIGYASGTTTGYNYGGFFEALNGNRNVGVIGKAITAKANTYNIGVLGVATNTNATGPVFAGGFFGLNTPNNLTITSAALIADNGSIASPILILRDNATPVITVADGGDLTSTQNISSSSKTAGIGYAVGSGSTVTQATSRTTGVTINAITGSITLVSAAGSATWQTFTVTNSAVTAKDVIIVNQQSGTDLYMISVTNVAAGSFKISFATTGGTTTEQPVFNFAVIKGQTN